MPKKSLHILGAIFKHIPMCASTAKLPQNGGDLEIAKKSLHIIDAMFKHSPVCTSTAKLTQKQKYNKLYPTMEILTS